MGLELVTMGALVLRQAPPLSRAGSLTFGMSAAALIVWFGSWHLDVFPDTFVKGLGVTVFKAAYEYVLCALNIAVACLFWRRAHIGGGSDDYYIGLSSFVMGVGEIAFTSYVEPSDFQVIFGHAFKLFAYMLLFRTTVVTSIRRPIDALLESKNMLRESESRLRQMIESAPEAIVVLDANSNQIVNANAMAHKLFGCTREELLGGGLERFYSPVQPDGKNVAESLEQNSQRVLEGETVTVVRSVRGAGGRETWCEVRLTMLPSNGLKLVRGSFIDITERKAIEARLERHQEELRELVEERTRELNLTKEAAESANLAKSAFLANMSHEIRTPLAAISGMARLIRRQALSAEQVDKLNKLEAASKHLNATINDVLDLSKIEANRLVLEEIPIDVSVIFENVATMLQQNVEEKGLHLQLNVAPMPTGLQGDSTRLGQALLNYASNAVKFTDRGTVILVGRVEEESPESVLLRFEVQDTGPGIAPEKLAKLFSPFVQEDSTTTRKYGGSGLGLAISKRLVTAMGGEVGVESEVGFGSTFWLTVRLAKGVTVDLADQNDSVIHADVQIKTMCAGRRVLLAEDDDFNREIATILLEDLGLVVEVAEDGQAALEMATKSAYDLILMDMQMPRLDGLEATRRIRNQGVGSAVPIVAMTANAFAEDRIRCLEAGMNDFLTKPVDPAVMYQVLLRQFMNRGASTTGY